MSIKLSLIHGTFAANARWVNQSESEPGSFRSNIKAAMQCEVEFLIPPAWGTTGFFKRASDLTNKARLEGAERLKQHILSQPREKGKKHILVAHSHGGNVAMYALQDPKVQAHIDGIVCMATPFLYPRLRPLSVTTLALSLIIMTIGLIQLVLKMELLNSGLVGCSLALMLSLIAIIVPTILVLLVAWVRYKHAVRGDPRLTNHVAQLSYGDPNVPIMLIRSSGDEASGLLRGAQFSNWLGGLIIKIAGQRLYTLMCLGALPLLWLGYQTADRIPGTVLSILNTVIIGSAASMVIMLMILTLSRVLVGLDAWRWVGELETMVEDGPPGITSELTVITQRQASKGLSHTSVYSEPETIRAIAQWCDR